MKPMRNTRQRQMVLDAALSRPDHPTADQLYLDARRLDPKISLGTVYRNLKILLKRGDLRHINVQGVERFDRRSEPHDHLLCAKCGAFSDAPLPYNAEADALLAKRTGYEVSHHRTVFEGICPDCLRGGKDGKP